MLVQIATISQFSHITNPNFVEITLTQESQTQIILKLVNQRSVFSNEAKPYRHFRLPQIHSQAHCTVISVKIAK